MHRIAWTSFLHAVLVDLTPAPAVDEHITKKPTHVQVDKISAEPYWVTAMSSAATLQQAVDDVFSYCRHAFYTPCNVVLRVNNFCAVCVCVKERAREQERERQSAIPGKPRCFHLARTRITENVMHHS